MKKNIIIGVLLLVIGIVSGVILCRKFHHDKVEVVQKDTVVMHDTIRYSRLALDYETVKLDLPKIGKKEYVFIVEDSTTIIYRDSIRYVTALRDFFYTRTPEVEIWHSGIDSRIDSLNVYRSSSVITQTISRKERLHEISAGLELNYSDALRMPFQVEYSYMLNPWMSMYGYAEYELFTKQFGIGAGMKILISW